MAKSTATPERSIVQDGELSGTRGLYLLANTVSAILPDVTINHLNNIRLKMIRCIKSSPFHPWGAHAPSRPQAWLAYGFNKHDYYIFFSNFPGFLLGAFMALSTYSLAPARTRVRLEVSGWPADEAKHASVFKLVLDSAPFHIRNQSIEETSSY